MGVVAERTTLPAGMWGAAITRCEIARRAAGISEDVIARNVRHWLAFVAAVDVELPDLTREDIDGYLLTIPHRLTKGSVRDSLRALMRWSVSAKLVVEDPMGENGRQKVQLAPPAWEAWIVPYLRSRRGSGLTESSLIQFGRELRSMGRDFAHMAPEDVTLEDLLDWIAGKRWARSRKRAARSRAKGLFQWARESKRIKKDPTRKWPVIKSDRGVPRPASDEDLTIALALADDDDRLALQIAAELGLRCGEIAVVHSNDLREVDGAYSLRVHGKGLKVRLVPMPESLGRAIHARGSGYTFPGRVDGHVSAAYMSKRLSRVLPPGITAHMLRHRFATLMYEYSRDTFAVQRALGHASSATTEGYVAISDSTMRTAVLSVSSHQGRLDLAREAVR